MAQIVAALGLHPTILANPGEGGLLFPESQQQSHNRCHWLGPSTHPGATHGPRTALVPRTESNALSHKCGKGTIPRGNGGVVSRERSRSWAATDIHCLQNK